MAIGSSEMFIRFRKARKKFFFNFFKNLNFFKKKFNWASFLLRPSKCVPIPMLFLEPYRPKSVPRKVNLSYNSNKGYKKLELYGVCKNCIFLNIKLEKYKYLYLILTNI